MSPLKNFRKCKNQSQLALMLNLSEKQFSNIVFSNNIDLKYHEFFIPKKSGGTRRILSPNTELKALQADLADILSKCYNEIECTRVLRAKKELSVRSFSSHGFRKSIEVKEKTYSFDIYSNADKHTKKKYVLNIDIQDFFETITFSRIVGFFCTNRDFLLERSVAILIAQVATYRPSQDVEGYLPQGSPLSPIISNLIGNILDNKILKLAKKYKLDYSRYADDITLSTNIRYFPEGIAYYKDNNWVVGNELKSAVESARFKINHKKTRLSNKLQRQEVTALTVNEKVNISSKYYKYTRSMVYEYCKTGDFYKSYEHRERFENNTNSLNGILSFIYYIKTKGLAESDDKRFRKFETLSTIEKLYVKFLFHYYFIYPLKATVICEGFTDTMHLKFAYKKLFKSTAKYIKFTYMVDLGRLSKFMRFSGGTGCIMKFLEEYRSISISEKLSLVPCIILVDGDKDGEDVEKRAKDLFKKTIKTIPVGSSEFHHIFQNLYLIKLGNGSDIENLYPPSISEEKIGTRTFNKSNASFNTTKFYGKKEFFDEIIRKNHETIDFNRFLEVFDLIHRINLYHCFYWLSSSKKKISINY